MSDWRTDLDMVHAWAGSWLEVANLLGIAETTARQWGHGRDEPSEEAKERIRELRERWQKEHIRSAEMYSLVPRTVVQLKSAKKNRNWNQVQQIIDRLEIIVAEKDPLVSDR